MDLPPPLKLIMVRGPREGETIEYRVGSTIRIGRIVRGNNLAIKDSGISMKHLTIESEGKWSITDLDSSNGTHLNSIKLAPHIPSHIHDGDTIKLGEYTSILIKFNGHDDESKLRRRNPRRRPANVKEMKIEEVEAEVEVEVKKSRGRCGRGRGRKNLNLREEDKEEIVENLLKEEEIVEEATRSHGKVEKGLDLERMTVGEWFDYMEVNFSKQIIEETEEMIEGMTRKTERVRGYMMEQKAKGKVLVG